MSHQALKILIC